MNYTIEAREVKQKLYGGYCQMCRKLKLEILPYHSFTVEKYTQMKLIFKQFNRNKL